MPSLSPAPPSVGRTQKLELTYFAEQLYVPTVSPEESSAPSGLMQPIDDPTIHAPGNDAKNLTQMPGLEETTKPTQSRGIPWHPKGSAMLHPQAGPTLECSFPLGTTQLDPPAASAWKSMLPC